MSGRVNLEDGLFRGKRLGDMTREELIDAIYSLACAYESTLDDLRRTRDLVGTCD